MASEDLEYRALGQLLLCFFILSLTVTAGKRATNTILQNICFSVPQKQVMQV